MFVFAVVSPFVDAKNTSKEGKADAAWEEDMDSASNLASNSQKLSGLPSSKAGSKAEASASAGSGLTGNLSEFSSTSQDSEVKPALPRQVPHMKTET